MPLTKIFLDKGASVGFYFLESQRVIRNQRHKHLGSVTLSMEDNNGPFVTTTWPNSANSVLAKPSFILIHPDI